MTVSALQALQDSELLDQNDKVVDISRIEPVVLQQKLDYYRNIRTRHAVSDAETSVSDADDLAALVSSVSAHNTVPHLLPSCFIYNRLYTNDPLMRSTRSTRDQSKVYNQYLGVDSEESPNAISVDKALRYFALLAPLIRIGVLKVLPIEEMYKPPVPNIPIYYSEDGFRSEVPEHLYRFVHENALINEVSAGPEGKGLIISEHPPKGPGRGIAVRFANDTPARQNPFYLLMEAEVIGRISDSSFQTAHRLDWDNPPDQEMYAAWVDQSVNRTIINRIRDVASEVALAGQLKASYHTESRFEAELCGMSFDSSSRDGDRVTAVNFLNANAPYLRIDDPSILARLRTDNPRLFERWQQSLLAITHDLNGSDERFEDRAKQLLESEVQPQVNELNRALIKLRGGIGGGALLTAGTIGLALFSSVTLPFVAVVGLGALGISGQAMPSVADYISTRRGPAFVWSKLVK